MKNALRMAPLTLVALVCLTATSAWADQPIRQIDFNTFEHSPPPDLNPTATVPSGKYWIMTVTGDAKTHSTVDSRGVVQSSATIDAIDININGTAMTARKGQMISIPSGATFVITSYKAEWPGGRNRIYGQWVSGTFRNAPGPDFTITEFQTDASALEEKYRSYQTELESQINTLKKMQNDMMADSIAKVKEDEIVSRVRASVRTEIAALKQEIEELKKQVGQAPTK